MNVTLSCRDHKLEWREEELRVLTQRFMHAGRGGGVYDDSATEPWGGQGEREKSANSSKINMECA